MLRRLAVLPQYLLPKQAVTVLAGKFANAKAGKFTSTAIRIFVKHYGVDLEEAIEVEVEGYPSFNEFFTRPLRDDARPLAAADFISPVDGAISQLGAIEDDQIIQAKGHRYSTLALLAGEKNLADQFRHGSFATLYLSPKDYHRIHMPCDGRLKRMIYVPGSLFSVNPTTARGVKGLFARNERVICEFESDEYGVFALVMVGATIVGSMATVWHGIVNPPRSKNIGSWDYSDQVISLKKGEEMGRFLLGSTVVLLFPPNTIQFNPEWKSEREIRFGEWMGSKLGK